MTNQLVAPVTISSNERYSDLHLNQQWQVSVVVPVFNEAEAVGSVLASLRTSLQGLNWEVIFVDDNSPDGTAIAVKELMKQDRRVRLVHRIGRRGLSSAIAEGILSASSEYVAVMDGDLQHDPDIIPDMLKAVRDEGIDIAVGTRYDVGGDVGNWSEKRVKASQFATSIAKKLTKSRLTDPMSGFFLLRRDRFVAAVPNLSSIGFKVLFELVASAPSTLTVKELPYSFRTRTSGESKLDALVIWEFGMVLAERLVGHRVSARFLSFCAVGTLGLLVHLAILSMFIGAGMEFIVGHALATFFAMTFNFIFNNFLTYSDQRLKGWRLLPGWLSFVLACSIGALANVGVASYIFEQDQFWLVSAIAGILVGTVWNFVITAVFTWGRN